MYSISNRHIAYFQFLQVILAVGLFTLRLMTLDYEATHSGLSGRSSISRWAHKLNNIGFYICILVALLEVVIAGLEKLALDDGSHSGNGSSCPVPPNTVDQ